MKKLSLIAFILGAFTILISCSNPTKGMEIVKATSKLIDIRDGEDFYKANWTIVPEEAPDVYTSDNAKKKITFYTDIDSISFDVEPDGIYNFLVVLNEVDTAWTQIKMEPSKLQILKKAAEYNLNDTRPIPEWTYLSANDSDLKQIRKEFNLDSIAGNGDEISRIKNLLYWVHDVVRHDGNSYNPELKNTSDLIRICREENRGINCRMMAMILNECYLAMGFNSRYITCMPRETEFNDCHLINMVYSNDLDKWVWMDPTFAAYVTDENGNLLGIREVRERLITDLPLVLNPDANWNHEIIQTKEHYLDYYMAKNLYRLECPVASIFNTETMIPNSTIAYIELLPLDGIVQTPQMRESKNEEYNRTFEYYKTNNPELFWAKP